MVRRGHHPLSSVALCAALAVAVASCSGDDQAGPEPTIATTTSIPTVEPTSDGQLTVGVMLPPAASLLRDPIAAGTDAAVEQINDAGGVLGRPVRLVTVDEGDSTTTASDAIQTMLVQNVDAIVGPASSVIALGTLESIVSSGTVACSPTASALAIDDFPDNGRFFRTIPSDSMQARAIGQVTEQTGVQSVAIVHVDDAYGRPFSDAVESVLASEAIEVIDTIPFTSGDPEPDDAVERVLASGARVVVLLADGDDGVEFLEALDASGTTALSAIIVNDALRSGESSQRIASLRGSVRQIVLGVAPQAESSDPAAPFDPPGPFAANAFDCVTLIALAASEAGSDATTGIANHVAVVSAGGQECRSFPECAAAIGDELQIDYNGPAGLTEIDPARGDPARARFDLFAFDDTGGDTLVSTFVVGT